MKPGLLRQFVDSFESGEKSARELTEHCLDQILLSDSNVHAWVEVDPQPYYGRRVGLLGANGTACLRV
jgi:Asp-tRNA(Asn)/Glu-tRNA(Gln) amidotransferase A subunit family amidase